MKKKLNVVMLATKEKNTILGKYVDTGDLVLRNPNKDIPRGNSQHLYFLSDEDIKEGNWKYDVVTNLIKKQDGGFSFESDKKIIATTDTSLFTLADCPVRGGCSSVKYSADIPQPTKEFIDLYISEYNKGNIIKEVEVDYELNNKDFDDIIEKVWNDDYKLKTNPDNTINISLIKYIMGCDVATEGDKTVTTMLVGNGGIGTIVVEQITPEIKTKTREEFLLDFIEHLSTYYGIDEVIDCTKHKDIIVNYTKNN